jgi:glucan phosphoethanolaminetransferase (alkaline phosphatase superfamily)
MVQAYPLLEFVLQTIVLFATFIIPDAVLIGGKLLSVRRKKLVHFLLILLAIAALMVASGGSAASIAVVLALFLLSAAWHLSYAYFGSALGPEDVLLFIKPDHFIDACEAGFRDVRRLLPAAALVAACCLLAVLVMRLGHPSDFPYPGASAALAALLVVGVGVRAALWSKQAGAYPHLGMPSMIGAVHALALAAKWALHGSGGANTSLLGSMTYRFHSVAEIPITVAVIMGESITPDRMSLFGGSADTTPLLARRAAEAGLFTLIARTGFSAGVASNSSVAGFLSGTPFPVPVAGSRNIFSLAKQQGFRTHYLSAQKRSPLDVSRAVGSVDCVETQETNAARFAERKDWILVDMLRELPQGERDFFFVYQRVNHAPYYNHQVDTEEPFHAFPRDRTETLHNYDVGLRSYDRNTDALLRELERREGAVFAFITADHSEMLGEDGVWGHNVSGSLRCAHVPALLFTNRPEHPVAQAMLASERMSAYELARLAMQVLGVEALAHNLPEGMFYISNALPFGRAGYMSVLPGTEPGGYATTLNDHAGRVVKEYPSKL